MSKTMNMTIDLNDRVALMSACERLNLRVEEGTFQLFRTTEKGLGIFLEGWKFPAVLKADGSVAFDNYEGHWGDEKELNKLKAYYGVEKVKIESWQKGYAVSESYNEQTHELELTIEL